MRVTTRLLGLDKDTVNRVILCAGEHYARVLSGLLTSLQLTDCALIKSLFVSDELPHYSTVLGELFHKLVPAVPTGKPGRPSNPQRVIDADLDYAIVHKTRQGA